VTAFAKHLKQLSDRMLEIGIPEDYWTPDRVANFVSHGWILVARNLPAVFDGQCQCAGIHVLLVNPKDPKEVM